MSKWIKKCVYFDCKSKCKTFLQTLVCEDASPPCRIDIFRVLRQSFCGKFQIVCGFWNPANPAFRMYELSLPLPNISKHSNVPWLKCLILPLSTLRAVLQGGKSVLCGNPGENDKNKMTRMTLMERWRYGWWGWFYSQLIEAGNFDIWAHRYLVLSLWKDPHLWVCRSFQYLSSMIFGHIFLFPKAPHLWISPDNSLWRCALLTHRVLLRHGGNLFISIKVKCWQICH